VDLRIAASHLCGKRLDFIILEGRVVRKGVRKIKVLRKGQAWEQSEKEKCKRSHWGAWGVEVLSGFRLTIGVHDLKNISIRLPEKEAFEGGVPDRLYEFRAIINKTLLKGLKLCERVVKGEVTTELCFEWGGFEILYMEEV
jgi:hypothetical protein